MADRDARRFEFGWLEVIGLVLIFLAASVVVFFLGVFVGKGLQESRIQREDRVVRLPLAQGDESRGEAPIEGGGSAAAPAVAPVVEPQVAPTPAVALAVRKSPEPRPTVLPTVDKRPEPTPKSGATPRVVATPRPTSTSRPTATPRPAVPAPAATDDMVRASRPPLASPAPRAEVPRAAEGSWSVQVNATKDDSVAQSLVKQLRDRGYNAFIVKAALQGETWYRVRVGKFATMEAATAVVMRLKNEERYSRAFLVNE